MQGNPTFLSIAAGKKAAANIYFLLCQDPAEFRTSTARIGLSAKGLDDLYEVVSGFSKEGKVQVFKPVRDEPWGFREFGIQDPDGNELIFFRYLEGGNPGDAEDEKEAGKA